MSDDNNPNALEPRRPLTPTERTAQLAQRGLAHLQTALTPPLADRITIEIAPGVPMELIRIPAGEFLMGSTDSDPRVLDHEKPQHRVFVPEFYLAKTPVTVAQWAAFVQAAKYKLTDDDQKELIDTSKKQNHPMVYVSWDDAQEFCRWLNTTPALKALPSGFQFCLPSEAEWEKAARGMDGRIYPWGPAAPDATYCNSNMNVKDTTLVGQYSPKGDSPLGLQDMAGNVWEWCQSKYQPYPYKPDDGREVIDQSGDTRVVRGGSWALGSEYARAAPRFRLPPNIRLGHNGFRLCVRPPSR